MKFKILVLLFIIFGSSNAQPKFKVVITETETWKSIYSLIDEKGKSLKVLDSSQYYTSMNGDSYGYFAIFGKKGESAWIAIDADEKVLFHVYNTSFGEPTPDHLIENKIRVIDDRNKIGFADERGNIIIKPQFEIATSFHNGKAIIGTNCEKVPWDEHPKENDCHHYSIVCENHGYINDKGKILKIGAYKFEEIMKEINWKPDEEY